MNLADRYHDEHGRPLAVPEPSKTSAHSLEKWQRATLQRAAERQEARAQRRELGPLLAKTAPALPTAAPAGRPEQPPVANLGVAQDEAKTTATKSKTRSEAARKAAATVRARREQAKTEEFVEAKLSAAIDRAQERWRRAEARKANDAAEAIANPGIPTAATLIDLARNHNAEADLYRIAQTNRASHRPSQWSPAQRQTIADQFNALISSRQTSKTKGNPK
jgi:hypothetical protein